MRFGGGNAHAFRRAAKRLDALATVRLFAVLLLHECPILTLHILRWPLEVTTIDYCVNYRGVSTMNVRGNPYQPPLSQASY